MKVDVIISAFGKPWQTLCALKSLMFHSGEHIDKIYLIEENVQAWNDSVRWIVPSFDNIVHHVPEHFYYISSPDELAITDSQRLSIRYQYGIENSDKKYVFITHTDMFYTGDIIGNMLSQIGDAVGIGLIGQCWNCPAKTAGECDSDKFKDFHPTYPEAVHLLYKHKAARAFNFLAILDKHQPMPMPECRLNDFACIIDRELTMKECFPNGTSSVFGSVRMDTGDRWFRDMCLKGYNFVSYDIFRDSVHGYYSTEDRYTTTGYVVQRDEKLYQEAEEFARLLYEKNKELWEKKSL